MSQIITFPPGTFPEQEQKQPSAEALLALLDLLNAQQAQAQVQKPKRKIGFVVSEPRKELQDG